ncbi:ribonuclease J [Halobacteriovorax sp. HLS]|uniref:ribonuclease J n=1 Tax=Halobacteriovorax sp. HLS TaxID=2234000 RepID=UPI000FDC95CF|nr:ribonuclease J [Halobacteriovorax sp. HLS]
MSKSLIKIQPVGGVGQIGSNMTLFETSNCRVIVDAGILFPSEDFFDINYLIPDLTLLIENPPTHLVITHGHEDHIGAINHIIDHFPNIEIIAPPFAAALIRRKLDYYKVSKKIDIYDRNSVIEFEDFDIFPIHVNHSIPDTFGLVFREKNEVYSIFLVSDFKIDSINPYEREFDFKQLKEVTRNSSKRILLADSTNILSSNLETPSEALVLESFNELFKKNYNRVYLTCFSSNIHRIQSVIASAAANKKRVLLYGRSMINYVNTAVERGLIEEGSYYTDQAALPNKTNLIVILSGCQGDFRGSFRRVVKGEDTHFKPNHEDLFIISSKAIPGNEKKISLLENEIIEAGAEIISNRNLLVHVSGHPGKSDLKKVYESYCPDYIVPIHGESLFLKEHANFIKKSYPQAQAIVLKNFDILRLNENLELETHVGESLSPILIHGKQLEIEKTNISKRRKLATTGLISLSINKESLLKRNIQIVLTYEGLPDSFKENHDELRSLVLNELSTRKNKLLEKTSEHLRIVVRRYVNNILGYKPVTIVHIV